MLRLALDTVGKGPLRPEETFALRVALLPLRLNIDQQAIAFLQRCLPDHATDTAPTSGRCQPRSSS